MKHQASDAPSRLICEDEDRTSLGDEISIFSIYPKSLAYVFLTIEPKLETIEKWKGSFVIFIAEACSLAVVTDGRKAQILTLSAFMAVQSTASDCHPASASVGNHPTLQLLQ